MKDISVNLLLTDEFVAFSEEIKAIHEEKKATMRQFKEDMQKLEARAKACQSHWTTYVTEKTEKHNE